MRLNVGCWNKVFPGDDWVNLDITPTASTNMIADGSRLPFRDGSIKEVFASDVLEHFPWKRSLNVLREWHRVLRPGGILKVKTPNLTSLSSELLSHPARPGAPGPEGPVEHDVWVIRKIFGGQEQRGDFHMAGFTPKVLEAYLHAAGFSEIKIRPEGDGGDALNMSIRAVK